MDFLAAVTSDLYTRYGAGISELRLVFPNKRAHLFFSQYLAKIIEKPLWQPPYKSMGELIEEVSLLRVADKFTLLVDLYDVYCTERQINEPFDRFYYWGETLLNDFDQIDKYCINAAELFSNMRERKIFENDHSFLSPEQIEHICKFWTHFSDSKESRLQTDFIKLWDTLYNIYCRFREKLAASGKAYEGMLYRFVADAVTGNNASDLFQQRYVFIGFNELNECVKTIFHVLQSQQKADFYWDYDAYYLNNKRQEAGLFLRDNVKKFPPPTFNHDYSPFNESKQISILAVPSDIAQAKALPQLINNQPGVHCERTAVVLADKQLLIPILHVLPAINHEINISMGYPLQQTAIYSLIEILLSLFVHGKLSDGQVKYHYKDILALLAHPYIKQLINKDTIAISNKLVISNNIYVSNLLFNNEILKKLLGPLSKYQDLADRLLFLMNIMNIHEALNEQDSMLYGHIQHIICLINKLSNALKSSSLEISIVLYGKILCSILRQETVPFAGEPLAGIQVLGLFETLGIDFDNVVVLSANEGILPASGGLDISFIPYNLRRGFGLPTPESMEAISAYYFYRLIQRAKHITLVYNTKNKEMKTGEASRYVLQLKMESGHNITEQTLQFAVEIPENEPIIIDKLSMTPEGVSVREALEKYLYLNNNFSNAESDVKKLSPSALNTYLACQLRFYFRYIAHLNEPDEVIEQIDSRLFGILMHKSMELIYKKFIGNEITAEIINKWLNDKDFIKNIVKQAIAVELYKSDTLPAIFHENGDLLMIHDILCQYIKQLLLIDKEQAPFVPEGIEINVKQLFTIIIDGKPQQLMLGGVIDRMHRKGTDYYVVDYKTGHINNSFDSLDALFGDDSNKRHDGILQIMLYSIIIQNTVKQKVTPLLYFLRESYNNNAEITIWDKSEKSAITDINVYTTNFNTLITNILNNIFDYTKPFIQTHHIENCIYCVYKNICRRYTFN